jgi:hypothetical protein
VRRYHASTGQQWALLSLFLVPLRAMTGDLPSKRQIRRGKIIRAIIGSLFALGTAGASIEKGASQLNLCAVYEMIFFFLTIIFE